MNIENIKAVSKLKLSRGLLITRKHSPEILTAVGIIGGVTAAVMGAKATLQLEPIVDKTANQLEIVKAKTVAGDYKTEAERKRVLAYVYTRNGIEIAKLYGPAVSLGLVSIGCIVGAQGIMQKRNVALVAAYSAVEKSFAEYRKRVEDVVGIDKADEIRFNATEVDVTSEDGKTTKKALQTDPNSYSVYARFFDEYSKNWDKRAEYNLVFLRCQQQFANDMLHARGHIFLNEVYDMLDIPRSQAGQVVGWVLNKDGDNFVDFGFLSNEERVRAFVNGHEPSIKLDFNVDGVIFDKIV